MRLKIKKKKELPNGKQMQLMEELKAAKDAMDTAYQNLAYVIEPDLIDCCIYELNALQLRYKVILNQVKEEEAKACIAVKK